MKVIEFQTRKKLEIVDITDKVEQFVAESKIKEGHLVVSALHATLAIIVNENENRLLDDIRQTITNLISDNKHYAHNEGQDNNATAHLRSILLGHSQTFIINEGRLVLGTWQRIMAVELDGPRQRKVVLSIRN